MSGPALVKSSLPTLNPPRNRGELLHELQRRFSRRHIQGNNDGIPHGRIESETACRNKRRLRPSECARPRAQHSRRGGVLVNRGLSKFDNRCARGRAHSGGADCYFDFAQGFS